ncbi:MAG: hypothetical protein JWQ30_2172, partial [Sediminibacterium sp.]|nr:hypothetical protein [Sediminibacterium sp.]
VFFLANKKGLLGKLGKSLSVNNADPLLPAEGAVKNEIAFNPYRGKIIRNILIEKLGFNRSVNDTTKVTRNLFNDIGNKLHPSTSRRVIINNLFFTPGDTLYPYLMADNERFLRELTYLQDARITVKQTSSIDSVDVIVICKDVFPFGGSMDAGTAQMASFEVNDDNLFGRGNRLQIRNIYDVTRRPDYGIGFEFLKRNFAGSFINLSFGYRNESPAFNSGRREEKNLFLAGELPLVSPYHVWTGAFEVAHHFTENGYLDDSLYKTNFKYRYRIVDGWIGYNIGARKQLQENFKSRFKKLIAIRAVSRKFQDIPEFYKTVYNSDYSDLATVLGSFTIFEQDYYHTNFLYGFGRNEDVPEGFSMSVIGGWSSRNRVSRPYAGFEYQRNYFSNRKNYINYTLRLGTYYNSGRFEDISFLTSVEYFTKLRKLSSKWYIRHFLSGSITQLARTFLNDPLRLSSDYGIPQLNNPDLRASTRVSFNAETVFYNTWKLVGFSFAPFVFTNVSYLKTIGLNVKTGDVYAAFGGGARTRNENLVFGTMELKAYYYPRTTGTMNKWNITFNTDLRFKYISQLIKRPDFAVVN